MQTTPPYCSTSYHSLNLTKKQHYTWIYNFDLAPNIPFIPSHSAHLNLDTATMKLILLLSALISVTDTYLTILPNPYLSTTNNLYYPATVSACGYDSAINYCIANNCETTRVR